MVHGIILDVHPNHQRDTIVTWLHTEKGPRRIEDHYHPSLYVAAPAADLGKMKSMLAHLPEVEQVGYCKRKTILGSQKTQHLLKVTPAKLCFFHQVAHTIDKWGAFHRYQLYNIDIRLPTRYLQERNVFFNAHVSWSGDHFILHDKQWATDYPFPSYTSSHLTVESSRDQPFASFEERIARIIVDDIYIEQENEVDTILEAITYLRKKDPDIIYTRKGDSILFPWLLHRTTALHINRTLVLGREKNMAIQPMKQEKSYVSYGRIVHRPAFYTLKGRAHIDREHSFFYGEGGLYGLVDVSRCANIPLQLLSRLGPGTAISQIQVSTAMNQGYLIPWKKTRPEMWKTATKLLQSDRGGMILEPATGLHEDIVELDYASLYPNIMLRHNISPETLLCSCCTGSSATVPQLGYHICTQQRGLLPIVLKPILDRRFLFKARARNAQFSFEQYQALQQAWKWVLLVCFGYTGYKNARYGRIECHESITAFSRSILLSAIHTAEQAGYQVLHGIVDSLWVRPHHPTVSPFRLSRMISENTGVRVDVEGIYHWIVFLPSKQTGVGALNRYYGLFENGDAKTRGIELRQHNTPSFFKSLQKEILKVLCQATTSVGFKDRLPQAISIAQEYTEQIVEDRVSPFDLVFTTTVSREISQYKVNTLVKAALLQLQKHGVQVRPGQYVQYVVRQRSAPQPHEKVCLKQLICHDTLIDKEFYLRYLARCVESLLNPFGYTDDRVYALLMKRRIGV